MYTTCKVKNVTESLIVYAGMEILPDTYYEIPPEERLRWAIDSEIGSAITSEELVVNDGTQDLDATAGLIYIKNTMQTATRVPFDNSTNEFMASTVQTAIEEVQSMIWQEYTTVDGEINVIGWYEKIDNNVSLVSSSPITPSVPGYHGHYSIEVSGASGLPFTMRIIGISVNESTGALIPNDTEDINVTANGYYQTTKSWIDAPQISIIEASKSCTVDIYRTSYWDRGNRDFKIRGCRIEWYVSNVQWSLNIKIIKVNNDGSISYIDNVTFDHNDDPPRAYYHVRSKYKRLDYNTICYGAQNEGIVILLDQTNIHNFMFELKL